MAKIKSVGTVKEFMQAGRKVEEVKPLKVYSKQEAINTGLFGGALAGWLGTGSAVFASDGGGATMVLEATAQNASVYERMIHAFDPLIDLIQALAYPVAMIVVLGGALFIMIGNKEKGFAMMQGAGLGYVLVQLMPMVLNILVEAMKGAV